MKDEAEIVKLQTEDGVSLEGRLHHSGKDKVILIIHGCSQNKDTRVFKTIAQIFLSYYDVFVLDFRGHGKSEGRFTFTAQEPLDLNCALEYLKEKYQKIGVLSFSLGAATAIPVAAQNEAVNSLIAVSAPLSFWTIDCHFLRKEAFENLMDNLTPEGRQKSLRPGNLFLRKMRPKDWVQQLKNTPTFFIHGGRDWIVRPYHSQRLYKKAGGKKKIKIVQKGLHAEKMVDQFPYDFARWTLNWFAETL